MYRMYPILSDTIRAPPVQRTLAEPASLAVRFRFFPLKATHSIHTAHLNI